MFTCCYYQRMNIFKTTHSFNQVIECFIEKGEFAKITVYAKKVGFQPDYFSLLQKIMRINPDKGAEFAATLANDENGPLVDIEKVCRQLINRLL